LRVVSRGRYRGGFRKFLKVLRGLLNRSRGKNLPRITTIGKGENKSTKHLPRRSQGGEVDFSGRDRTLEVSTYLRTSKSIKVMNRGGENQRFYLNS